MPPKGVTLAAFLPSQLKSSEQAPEPAQLPNNGQPRPVRCRCEGTFDLCWRYPVGVSNAVCKPTWDRLLAPFQFKGREWTIVELRSLWPHTVQALNERLLKGRMERTLKDDLQDDLQVLVDLIQHSCKPHPRPPRAGMKTLIVQGRILAEAIAQDALFQLDPSDPSAPRPDRDLVDLINRLRDHHPNSLLAPALHVLRTLGNTAVHLDRDSARLTDGEIGDAAAVCCRLVVLVVDAYMHMCANLHRHEETEEALAQPLLEAPVAPIPAPNVLLRQRDATPPPPQPAEEARAAATAAAPAAAPVAPPAAALPPPTAALAPPRILLNRLAVPGSGHQNGGGEDGALAAAPPGGGGGGGTAAAAADGAGARRASNDSTSGGSAGGSGGRRSCTGSAERVPYSLVSYDWYAHAPAAASGGGGGGSGGGSPRPGSHRSWWPSAVGLSGEAPISPLLLPTPTALLRRSEEGRAAQGLPTRQSGPEAEPSARPAPQQPRAASVSNWVQGHPMPYGLPGSLWPAPAGGSGGGDAAAEAAGAPAASQLPYGRAHAPATEPRPPQQLAGDTAAAVSLGHQPMAPYICASSATCAAAAAGGGGAVVVTAAVAAHPSTGQSSNPWVSGRACQQHPAGGSPRRFPIFLTNGDVNGSGGGGGGGDFNTAHTSPPFTGAAAAAATASFTPSWSFPVRGSSPPPAPLRGHSPPPAPQAYALVPPQPPHQQHNHQTVTHQTVTQQPSQQPQHQWTGSGSNGTEPGGGGGSTGTASSVVATLTPGEASKRLLQLCATAQTPPAAKLEKLLRVAASLGFADKSGMTPLHMACYWCHSEAARLLLVRQPTTAAAADREGRTPLWVAAQRGHEELVALLLGVQEGAAQVDVANAAGVTPLRVAAAQGHSGVVAALLQAGATVDTADKDGFTPLYVASARSQLEVVRTLLAAGAAVDRADKGQRTPLWAALHPGGAAKADAACPERRAEVVRVLLSGGADVYLLPDGRDRDHCWQLLAQSIAAGE